MAGNMKNRIRMGLLQSPFAYFLQPKKEKRTRFSIPMWISALVLMLAVFAQTQVTVQANTPHTIYSIYEVHNASPFHTIIQVRTGLSVRYVWGYYNDTAIHGRRVSYGTSMQVWQVSFLSSGNMQPVLIKANCTPVTDARYVSHLLQAGDNYARSSVQTNTQQQSTINEAPPITSTTRYETQHHVNTIVTVSNLPGGQSVITTASATWRGISIDGDEAFVRRTLRALEEIETGPEWAYIYVTTYLSYIVQDCGSGSNPRAGGRVNVRTRRFYVYTRTYNSRWRGWYASTIIHEAVHVRQYREHREASTRTAFASNHAERVRIEIEAVEFQVRFLDDIGATETANMARRIIQDIHRGHFWW